MNGKIFTVRRRSCRQILPAFFVSLLSLLAACSGIPVHGIIAGQTLDSRVDSEAARYYLANYLAGKHTDPVLDARIDQVYKTVDGKIPERDELKQLSDEFSPDFAALLLADEISRVPLNRRFRSFFDIAYEYARKTLPQGRAKLPAAADQYEALIVPTYLYNRPTLSGADLAAPRAALQKVGLICHFVETSDDGPVESNAEIVMAAIRSRAQSGHRLIIVSASKSGAEVALALTQLGPAETRHVAAWINTVGALQGTPLVDDSVIPELELIVGKIDPAGAESISVKRSRERFKTFQVPEHILVINFFGIPVSGTVGFRAGRGFYPMRKYGPNDGMVLLGDMIFPGGITLTELGSDHFLMNDHLDVTAIALAITIIQWLENSAGEKPGIP
jgi:hypothetical protein